MNSDAVGVFTAPPVIPQRQKKQQHGITDGAVKLPPHCPSFFLFL
jgi:hypothetical protein